MGKIDLLTLIPEGVIGSLKGIVEVWYGSNNTGKSFNATKASKPLLLATEAGGRALNVKKITITSWADLVEVAKQLTDYKTLDKMQNLYETIIIDTLENMVMFSDSAICKSEGVATLGEIQGKKNGYVMSRTQMSMLINKFTSCGYRVIFITHEEESEEIDELTGEVRPFIIPKGTDKEKGTARFIRDMADFVIYFKPNPYDIENDKEIYSTAIYKRTKGVFARSRFSQVPLLLPNFNIKEHDKILLEAITKQAELEESGLTEFELTLPKTKNEWVEQIRPIFTILYNFNPDLAIEVVENQLGEGKRISEATEDELTKLDNIYSTLLTYTVQFDL